ncbi:Arrestin domain-containing protein 3-like protein [Aphelenchoides bicaudatus]|nr:Arrestin domain-containing protein 3-like protein [Aphelenchoides bicaudatus]
MVPYNLPPAFKSRFGSILYWLEADLDIYGLFNKKRRFPIQVNTNYDLNLYHLLCQPQQKDAIKCYGVFEKEQVVIRTTTNKKAYSIGETIECIVNVETSCPDRYVKSIEVSLLKAVEYITRTSRKETNKFLVPNKVPICERTRETFLKTSIQVPETDPSFKTQNLYVSYFVMIKVRINGTIYDNYPEVLLPVQIGTLPIMSYS